MDEEKYKCAMCKESFQDGEVVATSTEGDNYHHIIRKLDKRPISCSMAVTFKRGVMGFNKKVYFKNNFYSIEEVNKLPNLEELEIEFNNKKNGDIIKGDLERLMKDFFGFSFS